MRLSIQFDARNIYRSWKAVSWGLNKKKEKSMDFQIRFPCSVPTKGRKPAFHLWSTMEKQEKPLKQRGGSRPSLNTILGTLRYCANYGVPRDRTKRSQSSYESHCSSTFWPLPLPTPNLNVECIYVIVASENQKSSIVQVILNLYQMVFCPVSPHGLYNLLKEVKKTTNFFLFVCLIGEF